MSEWRNNRWWLHLDFFPELANQCSLRVLVNSGVVGNLLGQGGVVQST